ncbi:hypothetical protein F4561_005394 [Lipingzhangella halophila]|uniref:Uncharacterized protein n=1 Tax=Lipingzhangella halophila TaxID=1783352 RepID=A0A7W7W661_9ACTN|nr:hypothetical protein [Lipingzhangella halophila]MBB4934574.1 hypothetical protein [Lipingzhangella halophila]
MHDLLLRDAAMAAAVLAFFASAWFGWAQERPPAGWKALLAIGSVGSVLVAGATGVLAAVNWSSGSVLDDQARFESYLVIVGIEFGVASLGAGVLALRRGFAYIAPWVCLVVGVHFFPMASVLGNPGFYVLAVVLTVLAFAAPLLAARRGVPVSFATGASAGTVLLLFALWSVAGLLG